MKPGIHPTWYPDAHVTCACGNAWTTGSTKKEIHTDVCNNCHPFFTGEQRIVDTAGQVERFMKRMSAKEQIAATQPAPEEKKAKKEKRRDQKVAGAAPAVAVPAAPAQLPLAVVEEKPTEPPVVAAPPSIPVVAEPVVLAPVAELAKPAPVAEVEPAVAQEPVAAELEVAVAIIETPREIVVIEEVVAEEPPVQKKAKPRAAKAAPAKKAAAKKLAAKALAKPKTAAKKPAAKALAKPKTAAKKPAAKAKTSGTKKSKK